MADQSVRGKEQTFRTAKQVEHLKAPAAGRIRCKDAICPGLYLEVSHTGHRIWRCQFKFRGNPRPQWFTLEPYHPRGGMSLKAAREATDIARERGQAGLDPFPDETDKHFPAVWERFKEGHILTLAEGTQLNYRTLRNHIGDRWDDRHIRDITDDDCDQLLVEIRDRARATGRGDGSGSQNNHYSNLKKFFRFCWRRKWVDAMPMDRLTMPNKQARRDRVLTADELVEIWNAAGEENYPYRQLVRFAMLVPARIWSDVGTMTRVTVNEDGVWRFQVQKTGVEQALLLPQMAREQLAECLDTGAYYFHQPVSKGSQTNLKQRMKARCKVDSWTFHDFRTATMTHLRELGAPFHLVDEIQRPAGNNSVGARHYDFSERIEELGEILEYWCYVFRCFQEGKRIRKGGPIKRWRNWLRGAEVVGLEKAS